MVGVGGGHLAGPQAPTVGHDTAQSAHLLLAVGHQQQLVLRLELHPGAHSAGLGGPPQRGKGEHLRQKMVAQGIVGQPPLVLHRQLPIALAHCAAQHAGAHIGAGAPLHAVIVLDVLQPTGGRTALEDEPVHRRQPIQQAGHVRRHLRGAITPGGRLHQPRLAAWAAHQAHRLARHPQADLHLRADGQEIDVLTQQLHRVGGDHQAVPTATVESQAPTDHDPRPSERLHPQRLPFQLQVPFGWPHSRGEHLKRQAPIVSASPPRYNEI
jgi:hypothetical protein